MKIKVRYRSIDMSKKINELKNVSFFWLLCVIRKAKNLSEIALSLLYATV